MLLPCIEVNGEGEYFVHAAKRNGARSRAAAESVRTRGKTPIELPEAV